MLHRRATQALAIGFFCLALVGFRAHGSSALAHGSPLGATTSFREVRTIVNGFSAALVHHNVRAARKFLSPRYFPACNQYRAEGNRYLRCLLDGTPLPVSYRIGRIERASPGSKELTVLVSYYLANGHYQPFYLNLLPGPHGLRIDSGGLPRG